MKVGPLVMVISVDSEKVRELTREYAGKTYTESLEEEITKKVFDLIEIKILDRDAP